MSNVESPWQVARRAQQAVERKDRGTWLACFAEDCRVEDPVGHVPALSGREALAGFWDAGVAPLASVHFAPTRRWETAGEVLITATVTIDVDGSTGAAYDGAFLYALDDTGAIASLRAFWDLPDVMAQLAAQTPQTAAKRTADVRGDS